MVTALVLLVATLAALDFAVARYGRNRQIEDLESRLKSAASVAAANPAGIDPGLLERTAGIEGLEARIVSAGQGVPEERGRSRVSVAVPLGDSTKMLRLAASPVGAAPGLTSIRRQVLAIAFASALLALLIAYAVADRLTRRVSRLKFFAESLLERPEPDTGIGDANDEIGSLERALNGVAGQLRELLERWQAEATRSQAILSSMAEGVLAVDRDMRIVFCNQAVLRTIGVQRPLPERPRVLEVVRDSELVEMLSRAVRSGETIKQTLKMTAANGRVFEVQAAPFATSGGQGALAILYDTTDIERLEQVRKDFVANVSHEMRTPLASIVGYADTLLDGGLEDMEHNRKFLEIIRSHAIRLNSIASDLLVLSELESGQNPGEPESIQVGDLLESAIATVEPEARNRGVQLRRGTIEDAQVMGHRFRLEQALLNLLVNAVKFNREGGEVRVEALHNSDRQIQIAVSDTGVGIPSQDVPRIFERFYRVDKARSRRVGGTGLGLSIVRHVVERMDGRIRVESQLGKGSTFTIILPVS
jgi:two-component system, OmpR family, phosphate regulon sensor histidine kinase PhoR